MPVQCAECGATLSGLETCQSNFHALLYRESEISRLIPNFFARPEGQSAHFLAVSCYAIQHPQSMGYTVDVLLAAAENVELHLNGKTPLGKIRAIVRNAAEGKVQILRRDGAPVHDWGVQIWSVTVADVLAAPRHSYGEQATRWAQATLDDIANSGQSDHSGR